MSDPIAHLDQDTLQGYLERHLDASALERAEAHLAECTRCRLELEGWRTLFGELDELPAFEPAVDFRRRVLASLPPSPHTHPAPEALQELVDGRLPLAARERIDFHVADCPPCASEVQGWRTLKGSLDALPRFAPSTGFAARVMAAVLPDATPARASVPAWERVRNAARGWLPKPGLGRRLAVGAMFAPVLGLFILTALLLLNPLTRPGDLLAFAGWQVSDLWQLASAQVLQLITETSLLVWSSGIVDAVTGSPGLAFAAVVAIWTALLASGWVLYRNVLAPHDSPSHHVHASR